MKKIAIYVGAILIVIGFKMWWEYKERVIEENNLTAQTDLTTAYAAARAFFAKFPDGHVTLSKLAPYGFVPSSGVSLAVISGDSNRLKMTSLHKGGSKTYTVNRVGEISF